VGADCGAQAFLHVFPVLDREVGDAAPGVELVGGNEGVRRAGVETAGAGPAVIRGQVPQ
jgi:hypothetical protein